MSALSVDPWSPHSHTNINVLIDYINSLGRRNEAPLLLTFSPVLTLDYSRIHRRVGFPGLNNFLFLYLGFGASPKHPVVFHWCSYSRIWELNPGSCMPHMGSSHFTGSLPIFLLSPSLDVFFVLGTQGALTGWLMLVPITSVSEWS